MNSDREELKELLDLLNRISKRLYTVRYVTYSTMYLGWCIWLTTIIIVVIIIDALKLPGWLFFAYYIPSLITTIIVSNIKLPSILGFIEEITKLIKYEIPLSKTALNKVNRLITIGWITGFIIMGFLSYMYRDLGASTGLLIAVGIGNLTMFTAMWVYFKLLMKGGLVLSTVLLVLAGVNTLLSIYSSGYEWLFSTTSIILIYLLFTLYFIIVAFK